MARKKKKTLLTVGGAVLLVIVVLVAMRMAQSVDDSPPRMMAEKHVQLQALGKLAKQHAAYSNPFNKVERKQTLRDTGRHGVGLFIHHVFFRIAGNIGFDTKQLSALLVPTDPPRPVTLDDPSSFVFKPLNGSVVLPPSGLAAQFNQYLTDYPDTQLRNISVRTEPDRLIVEGESAKIPGVWLPFHMEGGVALEQGHLFVYQPDKIEISGLETKGLLKVINLQLSNLLKIEPGGAEFKGNDVVLDLNHALPPPTQDVHVSNMKVDGDGLHLTFSSDMNPTVPKPVVDTDSYVMLQGGDLKTFRALITDVRMQLISRDGGKLDTSLYSYRQQIVAGVFDATTAGELVAYLGPYKPADYVAPATAEKGDAS